MVTSRGAHRPRCGIRPQLRGPAAERPFGRHALSVFFKVLICSLLALQGVSYAEPQHSDHASPKVAAWLSRAELALAGGDLVSPPQDNVLTYLERILAQDPANSRAADLLNQLIARFVTSKDATHAPHALARMKILKAVSHMAHGEEAVVHDARDAGTLREYLRPELTELKDCHVSLGLASLQLGDPAEAGRQQEAAADLVAQYRLQEGGLSYLSQLVKQAKPPRSSYDKTTSRSPGKAPRVSPGNNSQIPSSPPSRRGFGTF